MLEITIGTVVKALSVGLAFRPYARREPQRATDPPRLVLPQARNREAVDVTPVPIKKVRAQLATPLPPRVAAKRFVVWMQEHEFHGERPWSGGDGIWAFYGWHCDDERLTAIPDNMFAAALDDLLDKRLVRDRSTGKLRRLTYYRIEELPEPSAQPVKRPARMKRAA